jgi:DNA polymerase-3 subunit delta'
MHAWNAPVLLSIARRLERLPHALLLHGPQGIGKLALAERVAQLLLCEASASKRPCGACDGCRWFLAGNHPDFRRVEPEALAAQAERAPGEEGEAPARRAKPSNEIKVDQVRTLADFLNLKSHRGRLRVALVHPAEDMNPNAANALLKGLEEPPAGAVFLLVAHRPAQLPPTIRSRCVNIPVPLPNRQVAMTWLAEQGVQEAARWLAYAGGAPLRALHYAGEADAYDRLLSNPGEAADREDLMRLGEALQKIALDQALRAFGLPPKYGTPSVQPPSTQAGAWLTYARQMGQDRLLCGHPLNAKLFSALLLSRRPRA